MDAASERAEEIFLAALDVKTPGEREGFLERACAGDSGLRAAVEEMLASQSDVENFFDKGRPSQISVRELSSSFDELSGSAATPHSSLSVEEDVGKNIGPYKLLQKIGEGGCGSVYLAEQEVPVRRRVALKVIKLGMDTKSVIARFEAERQALAMMDHSHIARVLDAGATEAGRPFFVMELVHGVKITTYCDEHCLDARQRLELFVQICHAIQHAHQKGIIHRDIKPSNILVTLHDDAPVPKVIDFGIAKAAGGQLLTDKTLFTAREQFIGTPAYMSPEQAEMSGLDVDTRSDIYSLGVLLYELLTGKTPFDQQELMQSGLDQMRRTLREREPHRPSTRLDGFLEEELTQTALHRRIEPIKLKSLLSGDLDWIVMKALEKDRNRRYQTANGLAADVLRYLHNEPVVARPPSRLYRFQKLVRRNKAVFVSGAAVALALLMGLTASTVLFFREREARMEQMKLRQEAEQARASESQLRKEAETREIITRAAVLLGHDQKQAADDLVDKIDPSLITPSTETVGVFRTLGSWNLLNGKWKEAASRYAVAVMANQEVDKADRTDAATRDLLTAAPLLIETGDIAGYERIRRLALARLADTQNPIAAEHLVKISLLLPAGQDIMRQLEPLARVIRDSLASQDPKINGGPFYSAWRALALTLLKYRRGNYTDTLDWGQRGLDYPDSNEARTASAHVIMGMAQEQLGNLAAGRAEIEGERQTIENHFEGVLQVGNNKTGQIQDWFMARIFLREADALTNGGFH